MKNIELIYSLEESYTILKHEYLGAEEGILELRNRVAKLIYEMYKEYGIQRTREITGMSSTSIFDIKHQMERDDEG